MLEESRHRDILRDDESNRVSRKRKILDYWNMYLGRHWQSGEENGDVPTIARNKTKTIINKIITHAVGREPYVVYHNDQLERLLSPFVDMLIKDSGGMGLLTLDTFLVGSVTGDAFLKVVYDGSSVKIQVQESQLVEPYYDYVDNSIFRPDTAVLTYFRTHRSITTTGEVEQTVEEVKEVWDAKRVEVFVDGERSKSESGENLLGEIPFIHIRNQIAGKGIFGVSDVEDLRELNLLLNSAVRSFQDVVEYLGEPWMVAKGFKLNDIDKSAGRVLSNIPPDGNISYLELKTDLPSTLNWINMLDTGIHEQGGVPLSSTNGNKHMSNVSGTAYHYDLYPITEAVDRKLLTYRPGLSEAISLGLLLMYYVAKKHPDNHKYAGILELPSKVAAFYGESKDPSVANKRWNDVVVEFHDYLQKDEITRTQNIIQKHSAGLLSSRTAMKELGVQNVEQELGWIRKERVETEEDRANALYTFDKDYIKGTNEIKSSLEKSSSPNDKEYNDTLRAMENVIQEKTKNER